MLEMACLFQSVVVGEKVEDISDHPNLMEEELKLCYSICIVCGSYYKVTSRTLQHSLNGLLYLHVTSHSTEPAMVILHNLHSRAQDV